VTFIHREQYKFVVLAPFVLFNFFYNRYNLFMFYEL